jgi:hypothetical protein
MLSSMLASKRLMIAWVAASVARAALGAAGLADLRVV